ncbi:MAG: tetratricopeptide repeat protein [Paracoccaceae bacterium]
MTYRPWAVRIALLLLAGAVLAGCRDDVDAVGRRAADEAFATGAMLRGLGEHDRAVEAFERALASDPAHEASLVALGEIAEGRGEIALALARLRTAAEEHDAGAAAYRRLARLQLDRGALGEALRFAITAYRLAPHDPAVLALKARVLLSIGNTTAALRAARRAVGAAPREADAALALADALLAAEGPEAALAALAASPVRHTLAIVERRVALHDRHGRPEAAVATLRRALASPDTTRADAGVLSRRLATRLIARGRFAEAAAVLDARLAKAPRDREAIGARADLALAREGLDAALSRLDALIETAGFGAGSTMHRRLEAMVLIAAGQRERAGALLGHDHARGRLWGATLDEAERWREAGAPEVAFDVARAALEARPRGGGSAEAVARLAEQLDRVE